MTDRAGLGEFVTDDEADEAWRRARLSELAWVKALLESQLVAVDYPDVIPQIDRRMKAIEGKAK